MTPTTTSLTLDDLLILLIEECSEVIKAATKCQRFGYDIDHLIGYGNNKTVLSIEIGDLQAIIKELPLNQKALEEARDNKITKAERAKSMYKKG